MKKVLYTCLFGKGYDTLKHIPFAQEGWEYIVYTDQDDLESDGVWQIRKIDNLPLVTGQKRLSRYNKILSPPEGDIVVYIDAAYQPFGNLDKFIEGLGPGVHMTPHPQRNSVFEELTIIQQRHLDDSKTLRDQHQRYLEAGFEDKEGLFRCGCIVRVGDCSKFNEAWWDEICRGSWRDQPSAPFAAWKTRTKINPLSHGLVESTFQPRLHSPRQMRDIYYGGVKGELLSSLPKDSWAYVGSEKEFDSSLPNEAAKKYPLTHAIQLKEGLLVQRWLTDYIPQVDKLFEYLKVYRGTYAFYA